MGEALLGFSFVPAECPSLHFMHLHDLHGLILLTCSWKQSRFKSHLLMKMFKGSEGGVVAFPERYSLVRDRSSGIMRTDRLRSPYSHLLHDSDIHW